MSQWWDRKRQGLCTKCGVRPAKGKRMLLCDMCRDRITREREAELAPPIKYFHGERGDGS